jgi:hypothetical protein
MPCRGLRAKALVEGVARRGLGLVVVGMVVSVIVIVVVGMIMAVAVVMTM